MLIRIDYTRAITGMEMISLNPRLTFLLQTLRKLFINYGSIAKWPSELKLRNSLAEHGCRHLHVGGPTRKGHFLPKASKTWSRKMLLSCLCRLCHEFLEFCKMGKAEIIKSELIWILSINFIHVLNKIIPTKS